MPSSTTTSGFSSSSAGVSTVTAFETVSPSPDSGNSPHPPPPSPQSQTTSSGALSTGALIGITVAVSTVIIAVAISIIWYVLRRDSKRHALLLKRARAKFASEKSRQDFLDDAVPYPDKPLSPPHPGSREAANPISWWLSRQPSKYSALSAFPDGESDLGQSRTVFHAVHAVQEERELPEGASIADIPNPWVASHYTLPPSAAAKPDLHISTALVSSRNGDSQSAASDSETASLYSEVSASTTRQARKQSEPAVSPIAEHEDELPLPVPVVAVAAPPSSSYHRPTSSFSQKSRRTTVGLDDDEEYDVALRHGLQLPPGEEPKAQLERGKTKVIANLLLSRANRNIGGSGLKRTSTVGSTVSHIEREGEIMSPIVENDATARFSQYTKSPRPRTSFDVDLPANSAMDKL